MHLTRLLACIQAGTVRLVRKMVVRPRQGARAAYTLRATMKWPEDPGFPPCLSAPVADATVLYGPYRLLDLLLFLVRRGREVIQGLQLQGHIYHAMWLRWLCTLPSVRSSCGS